jgi:putative nucleotidyltransferase with HDIG domain
VNISQDLGRLKQPRFEEMINLSKVLESVFQIGIVSVAIISINVMQNPLDLSAYSILLLLVMLILLYVAYHRGYIHFAGSGLIIAVSVIITYNFIIAGGIHDNAMVIFPVLITITGLIIGKRFISYMTVLILVEVSVIYWLTINNVINPFDGKIEVYFHQFLTVFVLLVITGVVIWITVETIERKFLQLISSEDQLLISYDETIVGWGKALELFDKDTEGHSRRVTEHTLALARKLGIEGEELESIRRGALLHDIGKLGISDEILNKKTSLTPEERSLVEKHPLHAHVLIKDISFLEHAMDIPVYHHECWDGTGYPYHLAGEDIPLAARIFAIVDNWDALTSDRPYRKAWPEDKVISYIKNESGKKFDPALVELFFDHLSEQESKT